MRQASLLFRCQVTSHGLLAGPDALVQVVLPILTRLAFGAVSARFVR
jgi:hypothetical protein